MTGGINRTSESSKSSSVMPSFISCTVAVRVFKIEAHRVSNSNLFLTVLSSPFIASVTPWKLSVYLPLVQSSRISSVNSEMVSSRVRRSLCVCVCVYVCVWVWCTCVCECECACVCSIVHVRKRVCVTHKLFTRWRKQSRCQYTVARTP